MPGESKQKLPPQLIEEMERDPQQSFHLILRVTEATDEHQRAIERAGCHVRRRLTLLPSFAVTGSGQAILTLLPETWLQSVELDQPVRPF
jgi:hypothetical protein